MKTTIQNDIKSQIQTSRNRALKTIEEIEGESPKMRKIRFALRRKLDGKIEAYNEILEILSK